jgi:hypothetical protein
MRQFGRHPVGAVAGFTAGWASWLQAVFIPLIEVPTAITYGNSIEWVNTKFHMPHRTGPNVGLLHGIRPVVQWEQIFLLVSTRLQTRIDAGHNTSYRRGRSI